MTMTVANGDVWLVAGGGEPASVSLGAGVGPNLLERFWAWATRGAGDRPAHLEGGRLVWQTVQEVKPAVGRAVGLVWWLVVGLVVAWTLTSLLNALSRVRRVWRV
jgi:hypothetical protein